MTHLLAALSPAQSPGRVHARRTCGWAGEGVATTDRALTDHETHAATAAGEEE